MFALASCVGADDAPSPSGPVSQSGTPPPVTTSPLPVDLPDGMPATYDGDVSVRDLPVDRLVPAGDEVVAVERALTGSGEVAVIVFASPGSDPFAQARGFVVWRRSARAQPPWRAVYGLAHGEREGVLAISVDTADLTGDGSDDALVREETGGTGACATYRVIDLDAGAPIWKRSVCDTQIQPSPDPLGLSVVARVYEPGDPHCCPSAISERVLAWHGDRFVELSETITPI